MGKNAKKQKARINRDFALSIALFLLPFCCYGIIAFAMGTIFPFVVVADNPSSMSPTMEYGDVALIKHVSGSEIGVGDIIVFNPENWAYPTEMEIIHRVIEVIHNESGYYFRTKGDANPMPDQPPNPLVHESQVRGKVVLIIPKIGLVSLFLMRGGIFVVIAILGAWLLYDVIRKKSRKSSGSISETDTFQVETGFSDLS